MIQVEDFCANSLSSQLSLLSNFLGFSGQQQLEGLPVELDLCVFQSKAGTRSIGGAAKRASKKAPQPIKKAIQATKSASQPAKKGGGLFGLGKASSPKQVAAATSS